jgi:hypothetical protein
MSDYDVSDSERSDVDYSSENESSDDLDDLLTDMSEDSEVEKRGGKSMLALSSESEDEDLEDISSEEEKEDKKREANKKRKDFDLLGVKTVTTNDLYKKINDIKGEDLIELKKSLLTALDVSITLNSTLDFMTIFDIYINSIKYAILLRVYMIEKTKIESDIESVNKINIREDNEQNIKERLKILNTRLKYNEEFYSKYIINFDLYQRKQYIDTKFLDILNEYINNKSDYPLKRLQDELENIKKSFKEAETTKVVTKLEEARKRFKARQKKAEREQKQFLKTEADLVVEEDPRIIYLKQYIRDGSIDDSLRDRVYSLWNTFILNKSRYLDLNKTFKRNTKFIGRRVSDEEIEFFDVIIELYEKPSKIVDTVNNYLKFKERQDLSQTLNKEISINDINNIIRKFRAEIRDREDLTASQRDLLNLLEISFKRSVSDNPKTNEFSFLNFYIRALKYLLIDNRLSLRQMMQLGQIEENFGNILLDISADDNEKLENVKAVLKYIVDNNENQLKIVNILNTLKKGLNDDNVVGVLVINNYIKAIIATGLKDIETIQKYINEGKIDTEYGNYLLDIARGNIKKNVPELYDEIISNFSSKKSTKFIKDPLNSNLVRRRLRVINDDDSKSEKDSGKLPLHIKKCITSHKLREWNTYKYNQDYVYFIGHPRLLTKEEMKGGNKTDVQNIKYYGNELDEIDLGQTIKGEVLLPIYEPTIEFWKLHCSLNHGQNDNIKCNYNKLLLTLTDANGVRVFYHGLYNPKTKKFVIFNESDFAEECKYYEELNKKDEFKLADFYNFRLKERQAGRLRQRIIDLFEKIFLNEENVDPSRKNARDRAEDLEWFIYDNLSDENRTVYNYLSKVADISILFDKTKVVYNLADYPRYLLYVVNPNEFEYILGMSYEQKLPVLRFINKVDRDNIITLINLLKEEIITDLAKTLYAFQYDKFLKVNTKSTVEENKLLDKIININKYKTLQENLKELCEDSSDVNRVFLLGTDNEIYCATPGNFNKYLSMDIISNDDKNFIEELFGSSSRLYKERRLLYIYLAQQYLANDKNRDKLEKDIHEHESNMIELFGEVFEDDYDVINEVYKYIEDKQKVKLNEKERVEIFNYVRSSISDYSDMTQDIITLLTDKKDEYVQRYIKDYKLRTEKHSKLYDINSKLLKSQIENDIQGRIEIFKDILLVLAEKYRNKYVEFENLDFSSPFVAYLVQYMSELLDYIIKIENENFEFVREDRKETCYKCGRQSIPYTTTYLHEPSELVDDAKTEIELRNKEAYICSQDCLAKLQETIKEERQLKDDLARSCISTISETPKNEDIVIKIAKQLNVPDYERFTIDELWDIAKLNIQWVPDFNNKKILHCIRELCKLYRVKYDENKLIITWRSLVDNKKFYNEFISRIDTKKYENIIKSISTIYRQRMKLNENYFSVDCNILEKDMEEFLSQNGDKLYTMFLDKTEVKESDIVEFYGEFQERFKCAVKSSVMNKYKQYTRTVKLLNNYLLAVNRTIGSGKETTFSNIKNKMKDIQKNSKSVDTDLNYLVESLNNITKSSKSYDEMTQNVIRKLKTMPAMEEKTKINNLIRYIIPPNLIQLDFDEIMNVYEIYKKVGTRLLKYIRSRFDYNKDYKIKKDMESLLLTFDKTKPVKRIIRKGMKADEKEKIREERAEEEIAKSEKTKKKIKILQPTTKIEESKTEILPLESVVEEVKTAGKDLTEEEQVYINFDKFLARIQTFIDNYIRYKLEIKVKSDEITKPSKSRLFFEKELEEGEYESEEETIPTTKIESTSIKFSDVATDINKIVEEPKEEAKVDIFVKEEPSLVFDKEDGVEEGKVDEDELSDLVAILEAELTKDEEIDII